jgi:hypothetical protein
MRLPDQVVPFVILCASLGFSGAAIRASSCLNLYNRLRTPSISFFQQYTSTTFLNTDYQIMTYCIDESKALTRPCFISFIVIAKIFSTSTIIFTIMSVIASAKRTAEYDWRRLKKFWMHTRRSIRASWLASTSLAARDRLQSRNDFQTEMNEDDE